MVRVLMVSDQTEFASPMLDTIDEETPGVVVGYARRSSDALDFVERTHPDVVCLEAASGPEVSRQLKQHASGPAVVLIVPEQQWSNETLKAARADGAVHQERWQSELPQVLHTLQGA